MLIILFILLILPINIRASSYKPTSCTLPPVTYKPAYIQADNTELNEWRKSLTQVAYPYQYTTLLNSNKNIECLETIPRNISNYRRCFQYAIETITGFNGIIELPEENNPSIDLAQYFQQTPYPKKNDLIIYTTDEKNHAIHHFAVAIDQIWFQSKSGNVSQVCKHLPFDLTKHYGNAVWSFELKKEYQGDQGKKHLLQNIQLDLYQHKRLLTTATMKHIRLLNQKIDNLENKNKAHTKSFFYLGALASITLMVYLQGPIILKECKRAFL